MIRFFAFWVQAWRQQRWVFIMALLFVLGQVFFTYKGVESFPFHNFGMYSTPLQKRDKIKTHYLKVNGEVLDLSTVPARSAALVNYQLQYYLQLQQQDFNDPIGQTIDARFGGWLTAAQRQQWKAQLSNDAASAKALGPWLKRYLQAAYSQPIQKIELVEQAFDTSSPHQAIAYYAQLLYPI